MRVLQATVGTKKREGGIKSSAGKKRRQRAIIQLFSNGKLITPTGSCGNHWVLTVAHLSEKQLAVYDLTSTRDKYTNQLEFPREYLRLEADREKSVEFWRELIAGVWKC